MLTKKDKSLIKMFPTSYGPTEHGELDESNDILKAAHDKMIDTSAHQVGFTLAHNTRLSDEQLKQLADHPKTRKMAKNVAQARLKQRSGQKLDTMDRILLGRHIQH